MALSFHAPLPVTTPDAGPAFTTREPMAVYRRLRQKGLLQPDPAQQLAIERLQSLYRAFVEYRPETGLRGWFARFGLSRGVEPAQAAGPFPRLHARSP